MIDAKVFAGWMGALSERFGRPLGDAGTKAYHAILSRQLTTQQFDVAAAIIFARFEYKGSWPAPERFVDAAQPKGATELDAGAVLARVRQLHRMEGYSLTASPEYHALPDYIKRAVGAVGGAQRIHETTLEQEPFLLRDFAKALTQAKDHQDRAAIAGVLPSSADTSVRQLVGSVASKLALAGPRTMHGEPIASPDLTPEQLEEVKAAHAWIQENPRVSEVIRARLRREAPKSAGVDESDIGFRAMYEAACLNAYRQMLAANREREASEPVSARSA